MTLGLEQIEGALMDVPPGNGTDGSQSCDVRYTLHDPEQERELLYPPEPAVQYEAKHPCAPPTFEPVFEWSPESSERLHALADAAGDTIRQSIELRGVDALGWYSSFHVRGLQWGAYVSLAGAAYLAKVAFAGLRATDETKLRLAFQAILQHELFHFATDYAVAQLELMTHHPCWTVAKDHWKNVQPGYLQVEEQLANAWMLKQFRTAFPGYRAKGKQAALIDFVKRQPTGYRDAPDVRTMNDWNVRIRELSLSYLPDGAWAGNEAAVDWPAFYPIRPRIDWRQCAIHLIDDSARYGVPPGWLTHFEAICVDRESERFKKMLRKLDPSIQKAWSAVRARLAEQIRPGMI